MSEMSCKDRELKILKIIKESFGFPMSANDFKVYIELLILNCECIKNNQSPEITLDELKNNTNIASVTSISRTNRRLQNYNLIRIIPGRGRGNSNVYFVNNLHSV